MKSNGIIGEFEDVAALVHAARSAAAAGYCRWDAFSPYPIEELNELVPGRSRVPLYALVGGIMGASLAFGIQTWAWVWDFPIDVGGRPLFSWPAFIPITFEMTVLFSALSAGFGMLAANRLPELYHPVFEVPAFIRASRDRFFLWIHANDERSVPDLETLRKDLRSWGAVSVQEVPPHPDDMHEEGGKTA